jgi:hypothetical protein
MHLPRVVLWLSAVSFAGFGTAFTLFPVRMAALVEIELPTDTARTDLVATYGGFELGVAFFLWLCTRDDARVRLGLLASGCALTGFASARLFGILTSNAVRPAIYAALTLEILGAVLSFWAAGKSD